MTHIVIISLGKFQIVLIRMYFLPSIFLSDCQIFIVLTKFNENARSKDSEETTSCACNTGRDNRMGQTQIMDDVQTLFCLTDAASMHLDADSYPRMRCQCVS